MAILNFKMFESFYYNGKNSLYTLNSSIRNLIINLESNNTFKSKYLADQFKLDINNYRKELGLNPTNKELNPSNILETLKKDIDEELIEELGVIDLFKDIEDLLAESSIESVQISLNYIFDSYDKNIDKCITNLNKLFVNKTKKSKRYSPLNGITLVDSDMPFSEYRRKKYLLQVELNKLQQWITNSKKKILIVIDGRDSSGKSSTIKTLSENMDNKHYRIVKFDIPTEAQSKDWFKRFEDSMPKEGEIVIFDRSWYNRAIIEPAMGWCSKEQYEDFFKKVENFEKKMMNNGIDIIKVWLSINEQTQKIRFELRKTNPLKYWKYSDADKKVESHFDDLTPYIERMLAQTNFKESNWKVIDSNDKNLSRLMSLYYILDKFDYPYKNIDMFKNFYS